MEQVNQTLKEHRGRVTPDVGTGAGSFIPVCKEHFKEYTEIIAIDSSERAVEIAKKEFKDNNIKFLCMECRRNEF